MFKKENKFKRFDFMLFFITIALCILGFIIINSATMSKLSGSAPYLRTQSIAFFLGLISLVVLVFIDYEIYGMLYIPIYGVSIILLLYALINPVNATEWGNVRSWVAIGPVVFQPSEVAKFGVIISVAKFIENNRDEIDNPIVLIKILTFAFFPVLLILLQPDLGTALVFIFFICVMIYIAGINQKYIVTVLIIGLVLLIIGMIFLFNIMQDYKLNEDYRLDRIVTFFYPELDPEDTGYQVIQSKTAIGSGMLTGRGLNKGVQNQLGYLPTKETDFIFAVIGEELGFLGGLLLLSLYAMLLYRLIKIAKSCGSLFGSLIVTGIAAMLFFHIFENVGMTMGLMPVTGIPLPFISSGGTFMLLNMISIGLALSVGMKKAKFDINDF